jgi:hypothetical protein
MSHHIHFSSTHEWYMMKYVEFTVKVFNDVLSNMSSTFEFTIIVNS